MFEGIKQDINAVRERDPAARNNLEVLLLYSGIHAILLHRPAHWLYRHKLFFTARLLSQATRLLTNIEIHPGAKLGHGILIDHGAGVVIGETAEVGDNCTIYQGATLGGTGKDKGKRHPTIGNNVLIGSGAKVLGPIVVGDNCKIASNAVLLHSLDENSTAVGVPARAVRIAGERIDNKKLDHAHIPDPVTQDLCKA
ncbi:MAG: serine O-acetyltransferase EpsC, partial [Oscillospiraceae bacterium]